MADRLVLIRHCDEEPDLPAWPNLARLHAWQRSEGQRPLTSRGRARARDLAERVAPWHPTLLLTSPLERARATAETLGAHLRLTPRPDPSLAEISFGLLRGFAEPRGLRAALARIPLPRPLWPPLLRWCWLAGLTTGVDTPSAARQQAEDSARRLATAEPDGTVAVVAHGVTLLYLLAALTDRRRAAPFRPSLLLRTGEYRVLGRHADRWTVLARGRASANNV
ncbi:MAG TPA: histidine phosphatase family protein [Acidobacteria bacterium]|nr:histidine phosphatase family protein [Acidobacteriota bacterium]